MNPHHEKPILVVASRNRKKSNEINELLGPYAIDVLSVADFDNVADVIEDGKTFQDNAAKKASQTAQALSRWTLGEDSGLSVEALDGAPGVYSARFSGPDATDESNNQKLIADLEGIEAGKRSAHYVSNIAIADPSGEIRLQVEAYCRGRITTEPRGTNGFGYDPYFLILEHHRTFGELGPRVKNLLSHRGRAFYQLLPKLVRLLSQEFGDNKT